MKKTPPLLELGGRRGGSELAKHVSEFALMRPGIPLRASVKVFEVNTRRAMFGTCIVGGPTFFTVNHSHLHARPFPPLLAPAVEIGATLYYCSDGRQH